MLGPRCARVYIHRRPEVITPVQLEMEAEDVAEERRRAEDPDPLDEDACIILQGLSRRYPAEVREHGCSRRFCVCLRSSGRASSA